MESSKSEDMSKEKQTEGKMEFPDCEDRKDPSQAKVEIVDKVCEIVKKKLALPEDSCVTSESNFAALGADSLNMVDIMLALEEEFGITLEEENAKRSITTVYEAADLIEEIIQKEEYTTVYVPTILRAVTEQRYPCITTLYEVQPMVECKQVFGYSEAIKFDMKMDEWNYKRKSKCQTDWQQPISKPNTVTYLTKSIEEVKYVQLDWQLPILKPIDLKPSLEQFIFEINDEPNEKTNTNLQKINAALA